VFAELAHERFCRPRPTAVSGPLDKLRQAFVDRTLEVSLHAACKKLLEQRSQKQRRMSHPDWTPRPRRLPPTSEKPQQQQQEQRRPELSPAMGPSHPQEVMV
jgi:hypothetical protein